MTQNCFVLSRFSRVRLFATSWTVACQAALSMGFSRQGYWSRLPRPPPEDLPNPGIQSKSLVSPTLAGRVFTTSTTCKTLRIHEFGDKLKNICLFSPSLPTLLLSSERHPSQKKLEKTRFQNVFLTLFLVNVPSNLRPFINFMNL